MMSGVGSKPVRADPMASAPADQAATLLGRRGATEDKGQMGLGCAQTNPVRAGGSPGLH